MKVLMIEPGKLPREIEIDDRLHSLQKAVGGLIEAQYPYDDPVAIICNEEGKIAGLPLNRTIYDENGEIMDIVAGTFLITGLGKENFVDLSPQLMTKYTDRFYFPEMFFQTAEGIIGIPYPLLMEKQRLLERDSIRLAESTDLAADLDAFLRKYSEAYAVSYQDNHIAEAYLTDELLGGRTSTVRMLLTFAEEENSDNKVADIAALFWERLAAYEKEYNISGYSIYQLEQNEHTRDIRFESMDYLLERGLRVNRDNYLLSYAGERLNNETLDELFWQFNRNRPIDFIGHSLSVSDVIVLHDKGKDTAYYVDRVGFKELPDFIDRTAKSRVISHASEKEQKKTNRTKKIKETKRIPKPERER